MNKKKRKDFIKECINDSGKATADIISVVAKMNSTTKTSEKVKAVSELLHISPSTVWRDYIE